MGKETEARRIWIIILKASHKLCLILALELIPAVAQLPHVEGKKAQM